MGNSCQSDLKVTILQTAAYCHLFKLQSEYYKMHLLLNFLAL